MINKLEKKLNEERHQREKLQSEIEELKKMNNDLCNAILSSKSVSVVGENAANKKGL